MCCKLMNSRCLFSDRSKCIKNVWLTIRFYDFLLVCLFVCNAYYVYSRMKHHRKKQKHHYETVYQAVRYQE